MKKLLAYLILIPWAVRANFLRAYRLSMAKKKFTWKAEAPEFFKSKVKAVGDANRRAAETGIRWHVVEPAPDKFVAVAEKTLNAAGLKSLYQTI